MRVRWLLSLDNLGHTELPLVLPRRVGHYVIMIQTGSDIIGANDVLNRSGVCRWLDALDLDFLQLLNVAEDPFQLGLKPPGILFRQVQARQARYIPDIDLVCLFD